MNEPLPTPSSPRPTPSRSAQDYAVTAGTYQDDRPAVAAKFHTDLARYRNLLISNWWIPLLCAIIGVAIQLGISELSTPTYTSHGRMIMSMKLSNLEGANFNAFNEEWANFMGTQAALMQGGQVQERALKLLAARNPDQASSAPDRPKLEVTVQPKTSIFNLKAVGLRQEYTRLFLQACMESYISLKRDMRSKASDNTVAGLTQEILKLEAELRKKDEELVAFAGSNSVVLLQEMGNNAGNYLNTLNQRLAALQFEHELLKALTHDDKSNKKDNAADVLPLLEGVLDTSSAGRGGAPESDYIKAKQAITIAKSEMQELSEFLRPQHPKMIAMKEEIARRERLLETYRQQDKENMENKKVALAVQIQELQKESVEWNAKVLEISRKTAEYQKLKAESQRTQSLYDRLSATLQTLDLNKEIGNESVTIMEDAFPAYRSRAEYAKKLPIAALLGLALSGVILFGLNKLDDRVTSLTELTQIFDHTILAQIPKEKPPKSSKKDKHGKKDLALLRTDDDRHGFLESFRSVRSSLRSDANKGARVLLVTSSEPNEGKSVVAGNLAIILASSGAKVLLVDADLRKGVLHTRFSLQEKPGVHEVLDHSADMASVLQKTFVPTLSFLSRGTATQKSGELFLLDSSQQWVKGLRHEYDYVVIDSVPVMAADDVSSIAPIVDGVIFVIRAERTSARLARASIETLEKRSGRILGLIFNAVRHNSGDYYYYYKYKDYYKPEGKSKA